MNVPPHSPTTVSAGHRVHPLLLFHFVRLKKFMRFLILKQECGPYSSLVYSVAVLLEMISFITVVFPGAHSGQVSSCETGFERYEHRTLPNGYIESTPLLVSLWSM